MNDDPQPSSPPGPSLRKEAPATDGTAAPDRLDAPRRPDRPDAPDRPGRLLRSSRHKVVGGVCGGLGRYFDLDPVVFRVPVAVLSLIGGLGLVFYGFAWLIVPAEGERENELRRLLSARVDGASLSAILVALVGCGLFLASLRTGYTSFSLLVAGAVGGAAYWSQRRRRAEAAGAEGAPVDPATAHAVADAPPETQAPPVPSTPSWWREPLTKDGTPARESGYLWGPDTESPYTAADKEAFRRRQRERRSSGGPVFALASVVGLTAFGVALGSGWLLADSLVIGLSCALLVYGVALAVTAFTGRVGGGTLFMVLVTGLALAAASLLPQDIAADWEDRRWAPVSAAAVAPFYEQSTGRATLDLSRVRPGEGEGLWTRARLGAGELRVLVPDDVVVRADIEVGVGGYRLEPASAAPDPPVPDPGDPDGAPQPGRPGGPADATGGGLGVTATRTLPPPDGAEPQGTLTLDLDVGVGEVVVERTERPRTGEEGAR
ncbi:PspC domain-containing protein [Streptomyces sp. RKND-216]|uniref:PspC domain-containing protein n=1 Tax=Streptomyces sp. RKND-216 TaxID=2562581 RepID=UPI00109DBB4C|nr:PspC domain-containing protein [Streptomyces sp. RKND-216]THA24905.1 PspC domain-containing protein [Streptomyces sp. RKND-216]